jgi:XRE family transcriptional regulator, stress-response regulator
MVLLRHLLGDALRQLRLRQGRTLREVSAAARVSLGYLSEVERGQKEASSELLASICGALGAPLSHVLREVSDNFALAELQSEPVFAGLREPSPDMPAAADRASAGQGNRQPVGSPASPRMAVPAGTRLPVPTGARMVVPPSARQKQKLGSRTGNGLMTPPEPLLDTAALPATQPAYDQVARTGLDITNMVPV